MVVRIDKAAIDLFAGGGGASLGIEWATGASPDVAINHDPAAIETHALNHASTLHFCEDVRVVRPFFPHGRDIWLVWASPDCFPAGTLVLTSTGLRPIETVCTGDLVLTHQNRWRAVQSTFVHDAETVSVRGYGHPGLVTTPTHGFYSKHVTKRFPGRRKPDGKREGVVRTLVENPYWPAAESMEGKLWATPHSFPEAAVPTCVGAELSDDFFYFVGRWVGDGSLNKGDVEICFGAAEIDAARAWFEAHPLVNAAGDVIPFRVVDHGSSSLLVWGNAALVRWLTEHFGTSCDTKTLPVWALAVQRRWRERLLAGYVDADGHTDAAGQTRTSSVSKALSISVRLLVVSLGYSAGLYHQPGRDGSIEGRSFRGRPIFSVSWHEKLSHQTTHRDTKHMFSPVRRVTSAGVQTVYSLQVAEDESFVADGIVVHNCTHHSNAKGQKPLSAKIRGLPWAALPWLACTRPRVFAMENVQELLSWGPLYSDDHPDKRLRARPISERKGETFKQFVRAIEALGYFVEWRVLSAADYGAPTIRRRLFLIARLDKPPVWPEPTHGPGRAHPWRTAAECMDWSIPCPSIHARRKPLADATLRRIAAGVQRFVLDAPDPFFVEDANGTRRVPNLVSSRNGERKGQAPRVRSILDPYPTVTAQGSQGGLQETRLRPGVRDTATARKTAAFLAKYYGQGTGQSLREPLHTVRAKACFALVLVHLRGEPWTVEDIGYRMVEPRELARGNGFPDDYRLSGTVAQQIARVGNSVPPQLVEAIVRAQL